MDPAFIKINFHDGNITECQINIFFFESGNNGLLNIKISCPTIQKPGSLTLGNKCREKWTQVGPTLRDAITIVSNNLFRTSTEGGKTEILRLSSRVLTPWQPLVGKNDNTKNGSFCQCQC